MPIFRRDNSLEALEQHVADQNRRRLIPWRDAALVRQRVSINRGGVIETLRIIRDSYLEQNPESELAKSLPPVESEGEGFGGPSDWTVDEWLKLLQGIADIIAQMLPLLATGCA
jgi:hypothetical protein